MYKQLTHTFGDNSLTPVKRGLSAFTALFATFIVGVMVLSSPSLQAESWWHDTRPAFDDETSLSVGASLKGSNVTVPDHPKIDADTNSLINFKFNKGRWFSNLNLNITGEADVSQSGQWSTPAAPLSEDLGDLEPWPDMNPVPYSAKAESEIQGFNFDVGYRFYQDEKFSVGASLGVLKHSSVTTANGYYDGNSVTVGDGLIYSDVYTDNSELTSLFVSAIAEYKTTRQNTISLQLFGNPDAIGAGSLNEITGYKWKLEDRYQFDGGAYLGFGFEKTHQTSKVDLMKDAYSQGFVFSAGYTFKG